MTLQELKLNWLLMSRMYYRSHNVHFDQWLVGIPITEKEFEKEVLPLLMQLAQNGRGGFGLLEETLELIGEEKWKY